jgi:hypothetical protein
MQMSADSEPTAAMSSTEVRSSEVLGAGVVLEGCVDAGGAGREARAHANGCLNTTESESESARQWRERSIAEFSAPRAGEPCFNL